jgi:hypothetical protein
VRTALASEISHQRQVNDEFTKRAVPSSGDNPFAQAAQIQQQLMRDPQAALRAAQAVQGANQTIRVNIDADLANGRQLLTELGGLRTQYKAALARAVAPLESKFQDLDRRAHKDPLRTEAGDVYKPWAVAEYNVLVPQYNAAVEANCATWFGASGPYQGWLKRFRDHLIRDHIPAVEQGDNAAVGFSAMLSNSSGSGYKSPATLEAVYDYLEHVNTIFGERPSEAWQSMK